MSSISNVSVAAGGITGGLPFGPYASCGGMTSFRFPPTFMPTTPWSHPRITPPWPRVNTKGLPRLRELSNSLPSASVPT